MTWSDEMFFENTTVLSFADAVGEFVRNPIVRRYYESECDGFDCDCGQSWLWIMIRSAVLRLRFTWLYGYVMDMRN